MHPKLGSLFDGSGGFPLAGSLCGIEPKWAAEVEPYPIAVTRSRFPSMKHLGDISKVNGAEIEPVDIITFGSPCQDLSVAGKRAGLKHEANGDEETTRSGLFMEAVRIIKEMRRATNGEYPTFALWENVPGAFSSNKGEDFRIVCEELIKIVEPSASMPAVPKNGWPYADSYVGDGWSLAYRVFDAQYWGVPQRRRRIHLVLNLRGERARKVLFEREGVRGYFEAGRTPWQGVASDAERSTGADDREGAVGLSTVDQHILDDQGGSQINVRTDGKSPTLRAEMHGNVPCVMEAAGFCPEQSAKTRGIGWEEEMAPTLRAGVVPGVVSAVTLEPGIAAREGGHIYEGVSGTLRAEAGDNRMAVAYTMKIRCGCEGGGKGALVQEDKSATLATNNDQYLFQPVSIENHPADSRVDIDESGKVQTLTSRMGTGGGNVPMVMEPVPIHDQATRFSGKRGDKQDGKGNGPGVGEAGDPMNTLTSGDRHAVAYCTDVGFFNSQEEVAPTLLARQYKDPHLVSYPRDVHYIVRRLTPTECARLQGFADRWGDSDEKVSFTPEEFEFWHEVRNTHAAINGKKVQEYTEAQMLTWYNKLHTDSSEYKMWGNGIALPCALYVMEGIAEVSEA